MSQIKTQIGEIAYNPALPGFEALVTFHTSEGPHSVAAQFAAPLGADFDIISDGLLVDALGRIGRPGALQSRIDDAVAETPAPVFHEPRKAA